MKSEIASLPSDSGHRAASFKIGGFLSVVILERMSAMGEARNGLRAGRHQMNKVMHRGIRLMRSVAIFLVLGSGMLHAQSAQEHVHRMAHRVMPFDVERTVHVFRMTESGGVQQVIVKDADAGDQIALVQQHLRYEAERFARGDYSDPATLHGAGMPGLRELQAGAAGIEVSYSDLPLGGQIRFETSNLHLITAVHRWFGAQLSEHGADARTE